MKRVYLLLVCVLAFWCVFWCSMAYMIVKTRQAKFEIEATESLIRTLKR